MSAGNHSTTILVVDDEADFRELVGDGFRAAGCTVLLADCAPSAMELLKQHNVDAIIADYIIPTNNDADAQTGLELFTQVRELASRVRGARLPLFVILTGFGELLPGQETDYAVAAIFEKPFNRKMIVQWVLERVAKVERQAAA